MDNRYEIAEQNGMSLEFADWFFDNKKDGCGNAWFVMMAAMWEGWKGRAEPPVPDKIAQAIENLKQKLVECNRYNYCADAVKGVEDACHAAMLQGSQPVSQTYKLPELIEGMEVSIDVSTCDADLGNRYFGTVTDSLELDTAKNCYILLVQDAEPNFDVNGNSPVTPDGWISCSERMPNDAQWCVVNTEYGYYVQCWSEGQGWLGDDISIPECDVINWMPLPDPPQEVNRG